MLARFGARVLDRERFAGLPDVYYFMLGPVIFEYPSDVLEAGHRPDHYQEKRHSDKSVDQVEGNSRADGFQRRSEPRPGLRPPRRAFRVPVDRAVTQIDEQDICD